MFHKIFDTSHLADPGEGKAWGDPVAARACEGLQGVGLRGEVQAEQEAVAVRWTVTERFVTLWWRLGTGGLALVEPGGPLALPPLAVRGSGGVLVARPALGPPQLPSLGEHRPR